VDSGAWQSHKTTTSGLAGGLFLGTKICVIRQFLSFPVLTVFQMCEPLFGSVQQCAICVPYPQQKNQKRYRVNKEANYQVSE
jgi:hypothetical protein